MNSNKTKVEQCIQCMEEIEADDCGPLCWMCVAGNDACEPDDLGDGE